jgi:hypothetical protein
MKPARLSTYSTNRGVEKACKWERASRERASGSVQVGSVQVESVQVESVQVEVGSRESV